MSATPDHAARRLGLIAAVSAFAVFLAVYLPAAGGGFIADDFEWALSSRVRSAQDVLALLSYENGFYRPVVALTFAADELVAGTDPRIYGLTNVSLALLCGTAVAFLARSAGLARGAAGFAAALWLLSPHGVNMGVLWISGRTSLLVTLSSALALGLLVRGRVATALACLALALFSKEEALLLPLVGAVWVALLVRTDRRRILVPWVAGSALVSAAYLLARSATGAMTPGTAPAYYRFTFDSSHVLRNVIEYADRALTFPIIVLALMALAVGRAALPMNRRLLAASAAWVAGAFALTIFLPVRSSLYVCLPLAGVAVAAAAVADEWWQRATASGQRRAAAMAIVIVLALYPVLLSRSERWTSTARFSMQALQDITAVTSTLPERSTVFLTDDRRTRVNLGSAFGTLLVRAHVFATGREMSFWIEPPLPFAAEAQRPCAACVDARAAVQNGRVVPATTGHSTR